MENIIVDLKIRIQELEKENNALKGKMTLIYSNWHFDFNRFTELKAKCKNSPDNSSDDITYDDNIIMK